MHHKALIRLGQVQQQVDLGARAQASDAADDVS